MNQKREKQQPGSGTQSRFPVPLLIVGAVLFLGLGIWWNNRSEQSTERHKDTDSPALTNGTDAEGNSVLPSVPSQSGRTWVELDDASSDGWSTEAYSDKVGKILKQIGNLLLQPEKIRNAQLEKIVGAQFSCDNLLPLSLQTVIEDQTLSVQRAEIDADSIQKQTGGSYEGVSGLVEALQKLASPFANAKDVRFKFKVFNVQPLEHAFVTRQYFAISGRTPEGMLEQNATWLINWSPPGASDTKSPQILWVGVEQFEQVTVKDGGTPMFSDCTESVLGENSSFHDQFLLGMNHWLERVQDTRYFSSLGNPGLAVGDVNGDGLEDLFVCQESHLPNRLYLQRPDGTAVDVSEEWGIQWLENSRSALLLDLDNDGDQDLVVAILGSLVVASNEQNQRFEIRTVLPTDDDAMSLSAADYDNDGDLDLYVCVDYAKDYFSEDSELSVLGGSSNRVYHDSNSAGKNSLFRNDSGESAVWKFTDVTSDVGLDVNNRRFSLAAAWDDYDNDGDQDLYVANDFGRNNLYRNDTPPQGPGKFTDIAKNANTEDSASGMSAAWGDFDQDGMMDIYVGNMFSSAGGRITSQPEFKSDASEEVKSRLQRFARGSTLMQNQGDSTFGDVSVDAAVTVGRWAWSSNFMDINNDGWQDIVVANGYITGDDTGDL